MASGRGKGTLRHLAIAALVCSASSGDAAAAPRRKVIDGIVAIVDGACVTRSELGRFLAPHEKKLQKELATKPAERIAARARLREEGVRALVERLLIAREAARLRLEVSEGDVDAALTAVATQNHLTIAELLAAARDQGLDGVHYRAELRFQILEGKLLQIDLPRRYPDWKTLSADAMAERMAKARTALLEELRARSFVEIRL